MTRDDKIRLNQMVQSVLHHQQNNEMQEIFLTTEKRKLVQAEKAMTIEEGEILKTQMELQLVDKQVKEAEVKHNTNKKYKMLFQNLIKKSKKQKQELKN